MATRPPEAPRWVLRVLSRLLPPGELRVILEELAELHRARAASLGRAAADRRYLEELRQYPARVLFHRVASSLAAPRVGFADLRQAARGLVRTPGITTAIVLTVGLGIGGCTAIFAIVDALYLRALPYPDQERIFWIYTDSPPNRWPFSTVDLDALRESQTSFAEVAAYTRAAPTLVDGDGAERIQVLRVSPGFFGLLGILPRAGRAATREDARPGSPATAVVTQGFAARRLGSSTADGADVLGRTLTLDGEAVEIVGVVPPDAGPLARGVEVFPTLRLEPPSRKGPFFLTVFGRLAPGVAPESAGAELRRINADLFPLWVDSYQDQRASWGMVRLPEMLQGDVARLLMVLMGAVSLLLLIAAANAANLLLSRMLARRRELAVRAALGASAARLRAFLLTESGLLALGGVAVGLVVAQGALSLLPGVASAYIPRVEEVRLSGPTLAFALILSAACTLLFGLVPSLGSGADRGLAPTLRAGGRGASVGAADQRAQRVLVVAQLAVAVPLMATAGMLLASFVRLEGRDPGFRPEGLVSMRVALPYASYPDGEARRQFWEPLVERIGAHPGVQSVALANGRPGEPFGGSNNFDLEDRPTPPGESQPSVPWFFAETGFFETLGIPLLEGRWFEPGDDVADEPVVVVDAAWARRFFPGESAVGRRMRSGGQTTGPWTTVVGVVGDVPYAEAGREGAGTVYSPGPRRWSTAPFLFVRTASDPASLVPVIREEVRRSDPTLPLVGVATGESVLHASLTRPRHLTLILGAFSSVALALAVVGLYGVLAHAVQRRRGDIAVRLALGGSPADVLLMVLRQGLALAWIGVALGLAGALGLGGLLEGLLYEVSPSDPAVLAGVVALMLAVSAAACLVPGRRAVRVDPASMLRED